MLMSESATFEMQWIHRQMVNSTEIMAFCLSIFKRLNIVLSVLLQTLLIDGFLPKQSCVTMIVFMMIFMSFSYYVTHDSGDFCS